MFAGVMRPAPGALMRSRAGNCVLITVAVVMVVILVTCGVLIVREYSLSQDYAETSCRFINVSSTLPRECQFCTTKKTKAKGKDVCVQSSFPCKQVNVEYTKDGYKRMGILHPDSLQARGEYAECSFEVCTGRDAENEQKVDEFVKTWQGLQKFNCYYHTRDHGTLIAQKKHTQSEVIHSMLWPSLIIVICGLIFMRLEIQRRRLTCCGRADATGQNEAGELNTKEKGQYEKVKTDSPGNDIVTRGKKLSSSDLDLHRVVVIKESADAQPKAASKSMSQLETASTTPLLATSNHSTPCKTRDTVTGGGKSGNPFGSSKSNTKSNLTRKVPKIVVEEHKEDNTNKCHVTNC